MTADVLRRTLGAMALALLPMPAGATPICRWVDQAGRTQFADVAPARYQKAAVCTESQNSELSDERRLAAEERVAQERSRARQAKATPPAEAPSNPRTPSGAALGPDTKRPIELVTDATSCPAWWRIYDESVACFGPYRTTRGATKAEAFDRCNVVASPESRCGPRRN